jgi:2'-5' RNA ligase
MRHTANGSTLVSKLLGVNIISSLAHLTPMADRCFVAVDVDDASLRMAFNRVQRVIESTGADVKSVEGDNIHITLKFLGEIPESKTIKVAELVTGISFRAFTLDFCGIGVFPTMSRPSVIWAGVSGEATEMLVVFTELEKGLRGLGFEPERRPFQPHVTLCRVRSGRNRTELAEAVDLMKDEVFGPLKVEHIRLKKSILTRSGPIYTTLAESRVQA